MLPKAESACFAKLAGFLQKRLLLLLGRLDPEPGPESRFETVFGLDEFRRKVPTYRWPLTPSQIVHLLLRRRQIPRIALGRSLRH